MVNSVFPRSFVYMLMCRDDGPVYVKIGVTDRPDKRLQALIGGCPVKPLRFAYVPVSCRSHALSLERSLLHGYKNWRTSGEWIALSLEEKPTFNVVWQEIFATYKKRWSMWPGKWEQIAVQPLVAGAKRAKNHLRWKYKSMGEAGRDYLKAGGQI